VILQTSTAALTLGRPDLLPPIAASALCMIALTLWSHRHTTLPMPRRIAVLGLKCLCFALLLACWLEPQWTAQVPKERANTIALLLDNSQSMQLPSEKKDISRGEQLLSLLKAGGTGWMFAIEKDFRTRSFTFSGGLHEITGGVLPDFKGAASSLGSSLSQVADRIGQVPAGIVVFTDGVASDLESPNTTTLPPVYPVILGGDQPETEALLGSVTATQGAFEDAPVTINAEIRATGMAGTSLGVRVEPLETPVPRPPAQPVAHTSLKIESNDAKTVAQLQFTPERSGPSFYRVIMSNENSSSENALSKLRNTRLVCVNRTRGPHPILYVAGRPNWEFPPLRRALDGDPELHLRALIRVAKREPKFQFKGRGGEATNPLFRGFQSGAGAEVQRYDQPVIVRVNVDSPGELASGFPKSAEELFSYKAVILDDLEAEFFSADQHRMLQRFVSERGGGLLMLGGMESFRNGGWEGTPLEAALPVWMGKEGDTPDGGFEWQLTREGLLQPWLRRRKSESEETARAKALPVLEVLNAVAGAKPAATILAFANSGGAQRPALVTQRYGLGRCAALLAGDWYRWGIGDPANATDLAKSWRQVARWLVSDAPNAVDLAGQWDPCGGGTKLQVRVRDREARPVEDADVSVRIRRLMDAEDSTLEFHAEPAGEPGVFSVSSMFAAEGAWVAEAVAVSGDGVEIGRSDFGWVQDHSEMEWRSSIPDRTAMVELARRTGGEVIRVEDLDQLAGRLKHLPTLATELKVRPLWHSGSLFTLAALCLVAEWFLRRRSGAR
jgi:uncharacterized membrane protein